MYSKSFIASLAFAGAMPSALGAPAHSSSCSPQLKWGPCEFEADIESTVEYDCSDFTVPLDYLDNSNKTLNLQVARVRATNGPAQGSIFFNFGGPGLEVRQSLATMAEELLTITEGKFDLIGWNPR